MDAREQLRRFLEQRREQGERELVLDGMSVEDVLRIVGASQPARPRARNVEESVFRAAPEQRTQPSREPSPDTPDWRQALRDAERALPKPGEPKGSAGMEPSPAPGAVRPDRAAAAGLGRTEPSRESLADIAPDGISFGTAGSELFGAERALATLDEVAAAVARCTRCPLYSTATNPVPGEGSYTADLMCVGEAPGQTEDETGRPFVGAAGQLLTKILAAIDLPREQVFIVNVLKHRPPGNRNPRPEEVEACSPYLVRQIELVQPKVIVAFGTFAAQTLLGTKLAIGKLRGSIHRYFGVPLIVTYHPAALLRNPAWKRPTWEDVQLARRILDRAAAG